MNVHIYKKFKNSNLVFKYFKMTISKLVVIFLDNICLIIFEIFRRIDLLNVDFY